MGRVRGGPPGKYYWLTAPGRRRVVVMARYASTFLGRIGALMAPLLRKEEKINHPESCLRPFEPL